jgi:hypothetical protein
VDRLDADAAAGRVEHLGEELAGLSDPLRRSRLPERSQIGAKIVIVGAYPAGEPASDALRHFRGASLGEGEAQDRAGIGALEQQPPDPRRQNLRLAGARRSGQPDMPIRIASAALIALKRMERARFAHRPYHSSRRISWSYSA